MKIISAMKKRALNTLMTKKVIELHQSGYVFDFLLKNDQLLCMQDNRNFSKENVHIKVITQVYDSLTRRFRYICTIDAYSGEKGLLIADSPFGCARLAV